MRVPLVALALFVLMLAVFSGEPTTVSAGQRDALATLAVARQSTADAFKTLHGVSAASVSLSGQSKDPKLVSHLAELATSQVGADAVGPLAFPADIEAMIAAGLMQIDESERVQVYVRASGDLGATDEAVLGAGGTVQRQDAPGGIVQALVPISQVQSLAADASVRLVRLPDYGFAQAGSKITEGDAILKANLARAEHGLDGTGVRVGVISGGDAGLSQSQASGDLPSVDLSCDSVSNSDAEGTAMMEIVHDIAPGAQLWFAGENTGLDFLAAVDCLTSHTDVVVDDISFLNAGLYDGTSIISENTSADLNDNAKPVRAYVTDAGNFALSHYQEDYSPCSSSTVQQFEATGNTVDMGSFGPRCDDPVAVGPNATLGVFLQWNDPSSASCNDYNLYLYMHDTADLLASSTDAQNCSQEPNESLAWVNPSDTGALVDIVIDNAGGLASPRSLDLFTTPEASVNFDTPGSSMPNQADAGGGVITTGAIDASDAGHDTIEPYSDEGPTNDNRTKPDITAVDCVSVTGDGGFDSTFCGTSAAAPHIAGIAALLLQCKADLLAGEPGDTPGADRDTLRGALLDNAVDLGPPGADNVYGAGRADAQASADALCTGIASATPTHSPSPTVTHSPTPTPTGSPTSSPSATPAGVTREWGNNDCSESAPDIGDAINVERSIVHLPVTRPAGCPAIGDQVTIGGNTFHWGDVDCSGAPIDIGDAIDVERSIVHLPVTRPAGCPAIGDSVVVLT